MKLFFINKHDSEIPKTEEFTYLNKIINPDHDDSTVIRHSPKRSKFNDPKPSYMPKSSKFQVRAKNPSDKL